MILHFFSANQLISSGERSFPQGFPQEFPKHNSSLNVYFGKSCMRGSVSKHIFAPEPAF